ncbi:MAG: dipeptidase [Acidobacteriaceae bacterium]|nr:dipeptidase [Acidobacteriaceae bacterium]
MKTLLFWALTVASAAAQTIGIDTHIDTPQRVLIEGVDLASRLKDGHVDIPRLKQGGMNAPFFALWVPTFYHGAEAVRRTLDLRDAMQRVFDQHPDLIELAVSASDVERITKTGKIAAILSLEGGHQIDNDLAVLRMYQRLGIRAMTLTHFRNTDWADSSTDKPAHNGLADFGKKVVQEMNRIGMIVDVSHVSDKTFYDAVAASSKPVIATHSSCRALNDMPRNMTDDMLRALAKNGGVVSINFYPSFVSPKDAQAGKKLISSQVALEPDLKGAALDDFARQNHFKELRSMKPAQATIDDIVANIDHAVKVAGIDHVGIGSDFDGIDSVPNGLEDISKMPQLAAALRKKGYSDADIQKIWSGNVLRVMRVVIGR